MPGADCIVPIKAQRVNKEHAGQARSPPWLETTDFSSVWCAGDHALLGVGGKSCPLSPAVLSHLGWISSHIALDISSIILNFLYNH